MLNLNENELWVLRYWEEQGISGKVKAKNSKGKAFYFLDGPPYATGELHPGQIWVKAVKDIFLRYRWLRGYDVHNRAGYDVHGLPVEHKVESSLQIESKKEIETKIGIENFVKDCKAYVDSLIPKMARDYLRFGISMDFDSPYIPYKNSYIENAWAILKAAEEKKLLYSDLKSMLYCTHCETVLAQGTLEVEYSDETDPSIFVAFKTVGGGKIETGDSSLLIWTTTPWTIPSNIAVAVNPHEKYVVARMDSARYILAKGRLDAVAEQLGKSAIIESEFYGSELEGLQYLHPMEDEIHVQKDFRKYHRVVSAEQLVSTSEGTGLVHIAPGHGLEDFNVGKKEGFPIFCPIDQHGAYTHEIGRYAGLKVPKEANDKMIEALKANHSLIGIVKVRHSYPHCWRCNSKLIQIASKQWFLNVQKVKNKMISENRKVTWHPAEAQKWQEEILSNSPDWCISRQRYWGIPIPIWTCSDCGNAYVIGSISELSGRATDKEAASKISDLHRPGIDRITIKCESCEKEAKRIDDVFDVWFDSGIAFRASLSEEEFKRLYPADFILEGKDQLRGWFSTLLKSSVMVYGKRPFNNVILDGMLIGEDGREMHKHLGNYISIADLLKLTSADAYRLWCSRHTQWLDIQFNKDEIADAEKAITILYNAFNLLSEYSSSLGKDYKKISKKPPKAAEEQEDLWIVSKLNNLIKAVSERLDNYDTKGANDALTLFTVNDFSRFYLKLAKKRVLYSKRKSAMAALQTINYVLHNLLILFAPFIPFTSEYLYLKSYSDAESIFLEPWPKHMQRLLNDPLEAEMKTIIDASGAILSSREKEGVKLRWPIREAIVEVTTDQALRTLEKFSSIICEYTNAKAIKIKKTESVKKEIIPIFSAIGPDFKGNSKAVADALRKANFDEICESVGRNGSYGLHTENGVFEVSNRHFTTVEHAEKENAMHFGSGTAYIDPKVDGELREEASVREFERRVQLMRKEAGLRKADRIRMRYNAPTELAEILSKYEKRIRKNLNLSKMSLGISEQAKQFDIAGDTVRIEIEKS